LPAARRRHRDRHLPHHVQPRRLIPPSPIPQRAPHEPSSAGRRCFRFLPMVGRGSAPRPPTWVGELGGGSAARPPAAPAHPSRGGSQPWTSTLRSAYSRGAAIVFSRAVL